MFWFFFLWQEKEKADAAAAAEAEKGDSTIQSSGNLPTVVEKEEPEETPRDVAAEEGKAEETGQTPEKVTESKEVLIF